jgi:ADP-ribosyl-[dinitrogen reductase] hydrolase
MRMGDRGICHVPSIVHHAYLRWLLTQDERPKRKFEIRIDGWLFGVHALHHRRAPNRTCLAALRAAEDIGLPAIAHNTSKGCGAVMRIAPLGLFKQDDGVLFRHAVDIARLTHGHPTGFLTAGYLAVVVAALLRGQTLEIALEHADVQLDRHEGHDEAARALRAARALAAGGRPGPKELETLGAGRVAEEALAIAVCCALTAANFADGIILAANNSRNSSTTAAITGSLLGAQFGDGVIPTGWLNKLELRDEITQVANGIYEVTSGVASIGVDLTRYPPN